MIDARARLNHAIGLSLGYLRFALDGERRLPAPSGWLDLSAVELRRALSAADAMGCQARKRLCIRDLNKIRARVAWRQAA